MELRAALPKSRVKAEAAAAQPRAAFCSWLNERASISGKKRLHRLFPALEFGLPGVTSRRFRSKRFRALDQGQTNTESGFQENIGACAANCGSGALVRLGCTVRMTEAKEGRSPCLNSFTVEKKRASPFFGWRHSVCVADSPIHSRPMQKSFPGFTLSQSHLNAIRNFYWHLRTIRPWQGAKRRKLYRDIAKHKAVLIADGFDPEELRLWCRQWSSCYQVAAAHRYLTYLQQKT